MSSQKLELVQFGIFENQKLLHAAAKNIISASRRTDIPAFYYSWLQQQLAAGTIELNNPLFPQKTYQVSLMPEDVHTIVLWSKDFNHVLREPGLLQNYKLYFQYTINHYSKALEPHVPEYGESLRVLSGLLKHYSPEQFNIRFDPVLISTKGECRPSPEAPHKARLEAFEELCADLNALGMNRCRITTSYLSMYPQLPGKFRRAGIDVMELNASQQIFIFSAMAELAEKYGLKLFSCASPILEGVPGIQRGHCIDGELLMQLFGGKVKKSRDTGQRKSCGCTVSRDIGSYGKAAAGMKCGHECVYCYA